MQLYHKNVCLSSFAVKLNFDNIFVNLRFVDKIKYLLIHPCKDI